MPKKKWLREFTLNLAKGKSFQAGYRETAGLLYQDPRRVLTFKRGVPIFSETVDTIRNLATGNRQYKPLKQEPPVRLDYSELNYHEILAKFQFHVSGSFPDGGRSFESELHSVASELSLVGFIKARSRHTIGHLQGDAFSLSYMRKWLEHRYNEFGIIDKVHIFDDNFGIPQYRYTRLESIKDWRSPVRRSQHMGVMHERARLASLTEKTRKRHEQLQNID